jgi:MoaA/NifB/PqqE/SkfB family radical SAM enzyme
MPRTHYPLLSLHRGRLVGPCASMFAEQAARDPRLKLLQVLSCAAPRGIDLLGLRAGIGETGDLWAEPTGLLARGAGRDLAEAMVAAVRRKGRPILRRGDQFIYTLFQPAIPSVAAMKVLASHLHQQRTGRPLPATATLQVTTACQCDCVHCSAAKYRHNPRPELTTEEWKSLIRQTEQLGIVNVTFTGGEALLRRDIYELIAYVDKNEANAMMFSNGLLLTEERIARLQEAGLFSLLVSLDSPTADEHDSMRRAPGCWEKAVAGIQKALAAGLLCGISTYATPERLRNGEVMEVIELGRRLGVPEVVIFDLVPTGKLLRGDQSQRLTQEDKDAICRLEEEVNDLTGHPHVISQAHVEGPTGSGCYGAWYQYFATAHGDITPCDFMPLSFGNIREEKLATIWQRMTSHAACSDHCDHCRMQDPAFRETWIDPIPEEGPFPFPITAAELRSPVSSSERL